MVDDIGDKAFVIEKARVSDATAVKVLESNAGLAIWSVEDYRREAQREGSVFLVTRQRPAGGLVGFAIARLITKSDQSSALSDSGREAELLNIAVDRSVRRRGLGTRLLQETLRHLRRTGTKTVYLEVRVSNAPARRFYESHGFVSIGLRKDLYSRPKGDGLLMSREQI